GNENLEIQWRLATLKETKAVVTQYHKYLKENSLSSDLYPTPKFFLRNLKTRARSYGAPAWSGCATALLTPP
ncbi:MAG: hypothetical protein WA720_12560, partial [Pseudolabrys sp.]